MDSAYFERAIFSLGNRVDVSVRARLFTGGTRRAIELRDRICTHPYCYEPAENCQVDHIEPYAQGGLDHPGERPLALRVPQPPAQPTRSQRQRPPPPRPEGRPRCTALHSAAPAARRLLQHAASCSTQLTAEADRTRIRTKPGLTRPGLRRARASVEGQVPSRGAAAGADRSAKVIACLAGGASHPEPASPRTDRCAWPESRLFFALLDPIQNGVPIRTCQCLEHRQGRRIGLQRSGKVLRNLSLRLPGVRRRPPTICLRLCDLVFARTVHAASGAQSLGYCNISLRPRAPSVPRSEASPEGRVVTTFKLPVDPAEADRFVERFVVGQ